MIIKKYKTTKSKNILELVLIASIFSLILLLVGGSIWMFIYLETGNKNVASIIEKQRLNSILTANLDKSCKDIKFNDLLVSLIIDNESEIKDVLFLNVKNTSKYKDECLVTREYVSSFIKSGLRNESLDLDSFQKGKDVNIYMFNTYCKNLTKKDLVDNFIIKGDEDNRDLKYENSVSQNGAKAPKNHEVTQMCLIYKNI